VRADQSAHGKLGIPWARIVQSAPFRSAVDDFIFNSDSRRVRNRRADAELRLDATLRFGAAHSRGTRNVCRPVRRRPGDAFGYAGLAENFLSLRLDFAGVHFGADQLLLRATTFSQGTARRRLAHSHRTLTWRIGVRVLLGAVELLLVSEMDLSYPGPRVSADFRDAATRLWRLHSLRAGVVCAEEFYLGKRTAAGGCRIRRGRLTQMPCNKTRPLP